VKTLPPQAALTRMREQENNPVQSQISRAVVLQIRRLE
jgi:hypothetical protein